MRERARILRLLRPWPWPPGFAIASAMQAQDYPNAPIHLISGFPAGSTADISARVVGAKMGQILGQQVVIENRLGAGVEHRRRPGRARAEGRLHAVRRLRRQHDQRGDELEPQLRHQKDFTPIALITSTPTVLVVTPELGIKSVKELIALAKAKPGTLSFGSSGAGSSTHLALELYKSLAKVKITHVPYTGSPQVVTDLLAGRIHGYFSPASTVAGHVAAGKLVALAVTDAKRSMFFPELPTMIEAGVPDCKSVLWFGISAPAGTPQPIIDKLSQRRQRSDEVGRGRQIAEGADRGGSWAARRTTSASTWKPSRSAGTRSSKPPACGNSDAGLRR